MPGFERNMVPYAQPQCDQFGHFPSGFPNRYRIPFTCYDHLAQSSYGEHWFALKRVNEALDRCRLIPEFQSIFEELMRVADNADTSLVQPTGIPECIHFRLDAVSPVLACALLVLRRDLTTRHRRHARRTHRVQIWQCPT